MPHTYRYKKKIWTLLNIKTTLVTGSTQNQLAIVNVDSPFTAINNQTGEAVLQFVSKANAMTSCVSERFPRYKNGLDF